MKRLRRLPMDVWFEPLIIVVLLVGYIVWYQVTTLTDTEQAALAWDNLRVTIYDHIKLTVVATVIVVAIAIPLGIVLTRPSMKWLNPIAVNIANIGQAAPAVGLLVLFTFWLGTGFRTAVVGLVVYAVLPILQNTIVGLRQVDQRTVEAARGIGPGLKARSLQQFTHTGGQGGITGCRPGQLIGVLREAVIVEQQGRRWIRLHGELTRLPMPRDHQQRLWLLRETGGEGLQKAAMPVPGIGGIPLHEKARAAPMWNKKSWHAGHVCLFLRVCRTPSGVVRPFRNS